MVEEQDSHVSNNIYFLLNQCFFGKAAKLPFSIG